MMKVSLKRTAAIVSITATSLFYVVSPGSAASPITPTPNQLIAVTIPNLRPEASVNNGVLQVAIPVSFLEGPINSILRANGGRYKDTDYQRLDVNDMRVSFAEGGLVVNGNWRFQAREYLGSVFGRKKYTPWVSVSGSFSQPFSVKVKNGRLFAEAGKTDIRGANKWYGDIVDALISRFRVNGAVNQRINQELQSFNGMNLQQLLVKTGSDSVAKALGISSNDASQLIGSRTGNINANITGGSLKLSVAVR
ncbi:MAG: hypothetical protein MUE44_17515 [Oscillatoriaceae cyanobacterium Prado104]|jgi:hypothetical protein|nr:hypothetical protein [Oscillatoriaceae cyanobacterium Prado104]